jgi:hypothetical protein
MFETMDRDFKRKPELTPEEKAKIAKEHELEKINEQADIHHTEGSDMFITQGDETKVVRQEKNKKPHVFDVLSPETQNELLIQAREELMKEAYSSQEIEVETMNKAREIAEKEYGNKNKN